MIAKLSSITTGARRALVVLALSGCGGGVATSTPETALASFARALREADVDTAYALTSEGYRRRVTHDEFARWMRESDVEIRALAERLARPAGPAEQEAEVAIEGEDPIRLVRDDAGWRVATDVVDYYGQRTPRQTLRSFVRAIARRRWDVVLRIVPAADRAEMDEEALRARWEGEAREELERLAAGIRAALDASTPIEERGDHAVMPWGERYRAQLVREDGEWRIEDPD